MNLVNIPLPSDVNTLQINPHVTCYPNLEACNPTTTTFSHTLVSSGASLLISHTEVAQTQILPIHQLVTFPPFVFSIHCS